jgi:hypothetical protein
MTIDLRTDLAVRSAPTPAGARFDRTDVAAGARFDRTDVAPGPLAFTRPRGLGAGLGEFTQPTSSGGR